ncbi:hypothetical protein CC78DRAFT_585411 [Lojkania enalia]|uniref:YDG domain-containing protein n=1 Tax=Lojkania enalia TaxID=147567 RepID=A0A9P4K4B4_9PLEO|nr:hypothetical protein CC78DRAFT_585411 [Didymosphaeria enalia]
MFGVTPPITHLSRPRLRQLAAWIRDDLDPVIAQDGPEILKPDDVLTLHEAFLDLRLSQTITALDLRATGIHRAVMEVAGTATRWPGRLADDCDKIIDAWSAKFGRLDELHPFMYGRGGRLEGIASFEESSKSALLKRWKRMCPKNITRSRSHRHGDLGFRAGAWWLNTLFAHYAGIIDLECADGGVCFDKVGAYAVLIKGSGEIEALAEGSITYRCRPDDKGRYRLTAANARSRWPIRILRCHNLNSVWSPKVGVRYEGLYQVRGWTIRPVRSNDISDDQHRIGDIMYEVNFERIDEVPMRDVIKHPTAAEFDDYMEYKRLRRLYRAGRKGPSTHAHSEVDRLEIQPHVKTAPAIPPIVAPFVPPKRVSPNSSQIMSFMTPGAPNIESLRPSRRVPGPAAEAPNPAVNIEESLNDPARSTLVVPPRSIMRTNTQRCGSDSSLHDLRPEISNAASLGSSRSPGSQHKDIKEVTPWIDFELDAVADAIDLDQHPDIQEHPNKVVARQNTLEKMTTHPGIEHTQSDTSMRPQSSQVLSNASRLTRSSRGDKGHPRSSLAILKRKTSRRAMKPHVRSKNPLAKLFDGIEEDIFDREPQVAEDSFSYRGNRAVSTSPKPVELMVGRRQRPYSSPTLRPLSPKPLRPVSPISPLISQRRDGFSFSASSDGPLDIGLDLFEPSTHSVLRAKDPFIDTSTDKQPLTTSLKDYISAPRIPTFVSILPTLSTSSPRGTSASKKFRKRRASDSLATVSLLDVMRGLGSSPLEGKITFKNLFEESREPSPSHQTADREGLETLPPDAA